MLYNNEAQVFNRLASGNRNLCRYANPGQTEITVAAQATVMSDKDLKVGFFKQNVSIALSLKRLK